MTVLSTNVVLGGRHYESRIIFDFDARLISLVVLEDRKLSASEIVGLSKKVPRICNAIRRMLPLAALRTCISDNVEYAVHSLHQDDDDLDYVTWWENLPTCDGCCGDCIDWSCRSRIDND